MYVYNYTYIHIYTHIHTLLLLLLLLLLLKKEKKNICLHRRHAEEEEDMKRVVIVMRRSDVVVSEYRRRLVRMEGRRHLSSFISWPDPKTSQSGGGDPPSPQNPPDAENPDPATLREQWKYAIGLYSRWYSHAWGTTILAGLSFFAIGWFVKGENPLNREPSPVHEDPALASQR